MPRGHHCCSADRPPRCPSTFQRPRSFDDPSLPRVRPWLEAVGARGGGLSFSGSSSCLPFVRQERSTSTPPGSRWISRCAFGRNRCGLSRVARVWSRTADDCAAVSPRPGLPVFDCRGRKGRDAARVGPTSGIGIASPTSTRRPSSRKGPRRAPRGRNALTHVARERRCATLLPHPAREALRVRARTCSSPRRPASLSMPASPLRRRRGRHLPAYGSPSESALWGPPVLVDATRRRGNDVAALERARNSREADPQFANNPTVAGWSPPSSNDPALVPVRARLSSTRRITVSSRGAVTPRRPVSGTATALDRRDRRGLRFSR